MATIVLTAVVALSLNACVFNVTGPIARAGTASSSPTPGSSVTPVPSPSSSPAGLTVRSQQQLQALVGGLRSPDGVSSRVLTDAELRDIQGAMALGPGDMNADPAQCREFLDKGTLIDYRIPTAAAMLGPQENLSAVIASSDASGYFWQNMYSIDRLLGYCTEDTFTLEKQQVHLSLTRVNLDLHGTKSFTYVTTLSGSGIVLHSLRMVAMSGNTFVSGYHTLPDAQPTDAVIKELSSYVNAIIDHADDPLPGAPATKQPAGPTPAGSTPGGPTTGGNPA